MSWKSEYLFVGCLLILTSEISCAKFPTELSRCKIGDVECIKTVATTITRLVAQQKGLPGLNLPSVDPLKIEKIQIKQGADSPVNIELIFRNADLYGLKDIEFTNIIGFNENPKGKYELHFTTNQLSLRGNYSIDGRVLILPIQGVGICNLTLDAVDGTVKFLGKSVIKNGKEYMQIQKSKFQFTTKRLHVYLGNLFNGDKALGDNTNLFLNENWEDIFNELKANLFDAFGKIVESLINSAFEKIPYQDMFLPA